MTEQMQWLTTSMPLGHRYGACVRVCVRACVHSVFVCMRVCACVCVVSVCCIVGVVRTYVCTVYIQYVRMCGVCTCLIHITCTYANTGHVWRINECTNDEHLVQCQTTCIHMCRCSSG